MSNLQRTQLLLEREQHETLAEMAKKQGRSISDVVREIIREHLAEQEDASQRQRDIRALEDLAKIRQRIEEEHGVLEGDLLEQIREERDEELIHPWSKEAWK